MLINSELVLASIRRARLSKFDQAATLTRFAKTLGEGERATRTSLQQRQERHAALLAQTGNADVARLGLERLLGGNDLVGINYLELGTLCARSVCRVHLRDGGGATVGFGTGFLVAPGVLLTNHHVISTADEARSALAEFDYEYDVRGTDKGTVTFAVGDNPPPLASQDLDFCLASVAPRSANGTRALDEFGWLPLNAARGKGIVGEYLSIIQHPGGERKQVCVRENKLLKYDDEGKTVWYMTDSLAGSSGSPVFNLSWQVVALHHSGVPKTDRNGRWLTVDGTPWDASMDESRVAWLANEGIRISSIIEYLRSSQASHPLAANVLGHLNVAVTAGLTSPHEESSTGPQSSMKDGELRVTIPVQIAVRVGVPPSPAAPAPLPPSPPQPAAPSLLAVPAGIEKVSVDQKNYAERPGYNPAFLSKDAPVPLPTIKKGDLLTYMEKGKKKTELKYWNYSVFMNKKRKLACFSAVNVDSNQRPKDAGRDGDVWYYDTRLGKTPQQKKASQIGPEFYQQQREFEADRSKNPFDRGHLTRRLDAQWGADGEEAKRNGDDSFHFTNCSPQHWRYNEGSKKWLGLEDYVIKGFAGQTGRACVINGPVFDAPLSKPGPDGRLIPTIPKKDSERKADPKFGGVQIPKLFFKVVACQRSSGALAAAGFLMSQEDLLATDPRIRGMRQPLPEEQLTEAEAKLYQVRIADLGRLTGLDFGPLEAADTLSGVHEAVAIPRHLEGLQDIRLS